MSARFHLALMCRAIVPMLAACGGPFTADCLDKCTIWQLIGCLNYLYFPMLRLLVIALCDHLLLPTVSALTPGVFCALLLFRCAH